MADGTVGEPPDDWPEITNAGVTYGIEFDGNRKRRAPLRDDGIDTLGWHRLLLKGEALEEFTDRNAEKAFEVFDTERRRPGYREFSEEEVARMVE